MLGLLNNEWLIEQSKDSILKFNGIKNMEEQVTISQLYIEKLEQENARLRELLKEVVNDDGSRYNRPSYYFKIKKALEDK